MTTPVLDDYDGLLNWNSLQLWIESQDGIPGKGPVVDCHRLAGGSQNNLFLMSRGGERFVLRRPPKKLRANSNETMLREARVLKALKGSAVPHAAFYAVCDDPAVIGACFYLMQPLEGYSFNRGPLPDRYGSERAWRTAIGEEMMRAAAALAAVDYSAVGLSDFGKPNDWHTRQVSRWHSQLEGYRGMPGYDGPSLPHVEEVGRWLSDNTPSDRRIGVIHGDFQFPNIMFRPDAPRISGLIDWELSTLGDPMLDLGWVLTSWYEPGDAKTPNVEPWDGFLTRQALIDLYARLTGRDAAAAPWFFVLACYKLGAILEGSHARAMGGTFPMDTGKQLHAYAWNLFEKAAQLTGGAPV